MAKKDSTREYEVWNKALPLKAEPVSAFAALYPEEFKSPAYVHVKYDRSVFGYKNKAGDTLYTEHPNYKIVTFKGINFVIPD